MAVADDPRSKPSGFEGGVAGLGLADLIQLNGASGFSGCFRVRHEDRVGLIFFRDGDVVHAEQGGKVGEEAFCDILDWPRGTFDAEPNLVPARRTIQKKCDHLLLDSYRAIDERRARGESPAPSSPAPAPAAKTSFVDVARAIPDVSVALILARDGEALGAGRH